ncbi:hypothetical protein RCL1_008305 [Eukaryota sp. TZLM3-RCL]
MLSLSTFLCSLPQHHSLLISNRFFPLTNHYIHYALIVVDSTADFHNKNKIQNPLDYTTPFPTLSSQFPKVCISNLAPHQIVVYFAVSQSQVFSDFELWNQYTILPFIANSCFQFYKSSEKFLEIQRRVCHALTSLVVLTFDDAFSTDEFIEKVLFFVSDLSATNSQRFTTQYVECLRNLVLLGVLKVSNVAELTLFELSDDVESVFTLLSFLPLKFGLKLEKMYFKGYNFEKMFQKLCKSVRPVVSSFYGSVIDYLIK